MRGRVLTRDVRYGRVEPGILNGSFVRRWRLRRRSHDHLANLSSDGGYTIDLPHGEGGIPASVDGLVEWSSQDTRRLFGGVEVRPRVVPEPCCDS